MSEYHPHKWAILECVTPKETIYKVIATWYGGYWSGDSWKISSGVVSFKKENDCYEFLNHSGSLYRCHVDAYGTSAYTFAIYSSFTKHNSDKFSMRLMKETEVVEKYK